jgi:hypothetical protein
MLHKAYVAELYRSLAYLATWLPTSELQLGDIVGASDAGLTRIGHVREHNLSFRPHTGPTHAAYEYTSSGAVSITLKLAGQLMAGTTLGDTEAGIVVKFNRADAIVFEASCCSCTTIADVGDFGRAVEKRYVARDWDPGWLVVTELVKAKGATIIISGSQSAQIDLKASGVIQQGGIRLSDIDAKFEAKHTVDIGFKIIAASGLTPLYRASGIKRSWLGRGRFRPRSEKEDEQRIAFENFGPEDLLP